MIGLGLADEKDITLKGLEAVKKCDYLYLESYTSILQCPIQKLEELYEKPIILADRNMVEKNSDEILNKAKAHDVAFLVIGDVFSATTHDDLYLRAKKQNIDIKIINNTSIMTAVGQTGLQLYKFGKTTSIVFDTDGWLPDTPYEVLEQNQKNNLHTLFLLDIKTAEPTKEDIKNDKDIPQQPRFMTIKQALEILLKLEEKHKKKLITEDTLVVGVARLGAKDQIIKAGKLKDILHFNFKNPLHSLIIPGKLHFIEEDMLTLFK